MTACGRGVKAGMVRLWVTGKTVGSPCYTQAIPYLSALDMWHDKVLYKCTVLYFAYFTCGCNFEFVAIYVMTFSFCFCFSVCQIQRVYLQK